MNLKDDIASTSPTPTKSLESYFIVPPGFQKNTFFVGMQKKLQEIHQNLFDKRRCDGTVCVLIHGQPGVGKSHLAREYVHRYRGKFRGGIFWVPAKLREEIEQAFRIIYQKAVIGEMKEAGMSGTVDEGSWVESVKAWFEARHEWLMVFDGIVVDTDKDATALAGFIPDSRLSNIIYISHAKNIDSKQSLLRPHPIKVSVLRENDARRLLFEELHIAKPTEAEIKKATELVRKIGGLPLAINAISHRLADTNEPLTKFSIKSYSADPKMSGTYNPILNDLRQRGHIEAWNLIHILCFFGQHIPMEMVHLGLEALRTSVNIKTSEGDGKPDIDTTIGILRRYALIERNEPDDKESMSSSRDSLVDPEPIDMLKVHNVVQNFCCDSLHGRGSVSQWLGYAVGLFIDSYRKADTRIKQKPNPGRASDYRYYLVHGRRLRDHSLHYETRISSLEYMRNNLDLVLTEIEEEIRIREQSSSQECMSQAVQQVSIFDRTSSSSDSGPSMEDDIQTPPRDQYRPASFPQPGQNQYGFNVDQPSMDSPVSFRTKSPDADPRIVSNSPRLLLPPYPDDGYDSELELYHHSALEMQKIPSNSDTTRPAPLPRAQDVSKSLEDGWRPVQSSKKPKSARSNQHPHRDLGSFRSTLARPKLNRDAATGLVTRPIQERGEESGRRPRTPSDVLTALVDLQQRTTPPQSSGGAGRLFWQRRLPLLTPQQSTYADILSGQKSPLDLKSSTNIATTESSNSNKKSSPLDDAIQFTPPSPTPPSSRVDPYSQRRELSQSRGRGDRTTNIRQSSLLRSKFVLRSENMNPIYESNSQQQHQDHLPLGTNMNATNIPATSRPRSLGPHPNRSHVTYNLSNAARPRYSNENFHPNYYYSSPPPVQGSNQESLLTERHVTISTPINKCPFPIELSQTPRHIPSVYNSASQVSLSALRARMPPILSPHNFSSPVPPGYFSQPLSRQPSRQSHPSLPDTEPLGNYPSSLSPPPIHAFPSYFAQDRRHPPNTVISEPTDLPKRPSFIHIPSSPAQYLEDRAEALRGAGGWASHSQTASVDLSMSRSSSGPGFRIDGIPGDGLGLVSFDEPGLVQFGEHSPISVEDARRRTDDYKIYLLMMEDIARQRSRVEQKENRNDYGEERMAGERDEEERGRARTPYPDPRHASTIMR